ncbi:hypothetical protein B0H17DRAFT_1090038 [Mycena rosella]|uniref:NADH:flavin oxidoreductase/NADH oxidase N-terminal domain-containing protein n=1 Tax=Mycena rosella TaxID=1033263 RepID=A0AAD7CWX9_MYCRO|nr:hypothetical protein B0H17DRAFT_1090038 [Mycena rosella]
MSPQLFQPHKIGTTALKHRVVLAPMTRYKADTNHVPYLPLVSDFYSQRASRPGTLLITEATFIAAARAERPTSRVTDSVHAKGSFIFMQLYALGRTADPEQLISEDPSFPYVSASDVQLTGRDTPPRPLSVQEINEYIALFAQAAKNAMSAGFDGVEIHNSNGYILDQFLQDVSNKRSDAYGGSIENRARFTLEVVDAVVAAIGVEKTGIRFSPHVLDMGMIDPIPTFSYVISALAARHPDLAYVHLIEARINGNAARDESQVGAHELNDVLLALWAPRPLIRAGGFSRRRLISFGRFFISNPDLPMRLEKDVPLNPYDRSTFNLIGENIPRGYTDQPFAVAA